MPGRTAVNTADRHPDNLRDVLRYGLVLSVLLASALGFVLWRDHQAKLEAAGQRSTALAQATAALVEFEMRNLDRALRGIVADMEELGTAAADETALATGLVRGVAERQGELASVVVLDADGRALTPGPGLPGLAAWVDKPDRRTGRDGLRLGPPRRGPDGHWLLPLVRPLPPDRWVMAELRLDSLQQSLRELDAGPRGLAVLLALDGTVLARSREVDPQVGKRHPEPGLVRDALSPPGDEVATDVSRIDGVSRIRATRALENFPMVLAVGLSREDVLSSWRPFVVVAMFACSLYVIGWWYLMRRLTRAHARQRLLLRENARGTAQLHEAQRIGNLGSFSVDVENRVVEYSPEARRIHGFPDDDRPIELDAGFKALHPEDREKVQAWLGAFREGGTAPVESQFRLVHPDGKVRVVRARGTRVRDVDGRLRDAGTVLDITDRALAQDALAAAERQYRFMFDRNPLPFWVYRRDTLQFMAVNDAAVATYGYSREEFLAMTLLDIRPADDAEALRAAVRKAEDNQPGQLWRHTRKDGSTLDVQIHAAHIEFQGHACRLVLVEDVTERLRTQAEVAYRADHDVLTGLSNRSALLLQVETMLAATAGTGLPVHVIHIDLQQFKLINDSLGHSVGDEVLKTVAARLTTLAEGLAVARLGGDEFAIAWKGGEGAPGVDELAARAQAALAVPVNVLGTLHRLSPSVGMASYPQDAGDAERLLRNAGLANHEAKRRGQSQAVRFFVELEHAVNDRLQMVARMHEALEREEFELHFQTQFFTSGREPVGIEALVRWRHPERGLVPPNEFIPICEDSGLIVPLGRWVLREAARHHRLLADAGWPGLTIAVNVSAMQFQSGELAADVKALVEEFHLPPGILELELTESIVMGSPEAAIEALEQLRQYGVLLSIDDFGTGYSSMAYLHRLPVDKLKIDRSFVKDVEQDSHNAAICESVLALARSFGIRVVAEGVETEAQLDWLRQRGCDEVQGFLLARPQPFTQVLENLRQPRR